MGWWGTSIMDGDSPLDIEDALYESMGVDKWPKDSEPGDKTPELPDETFELTHIVNFLSANPWIKNGNGYDDLNIFYQVIGYHMLERGMKIDKYLQEKIIEACDDDYWSKYDNERYQQIQGFKKYIEENKGEKVKLSSKGLLEKLFE